MGKLIGIKKKNIGNQREMLDLPDLGEDLMELVKKLVDCNPSKYSKKKEIFRAEFLGEKENDDEKKIELLDEELDFAAGGIEEGNHMDQIIPSKKT